MKPLMLVLGPAFELVTGTVTVQLLLSAIVPPVRLILPVPTAAVKVPPHVVLAAAEMVIPVGSVSLKLTPVKATLLGLVKVKVRVDVPPDPIEVGEKALVKVGLLGVPQPVKVTPSISTVCPLLLLPALYTYNRKIVFPLGFKPVFNEVGPKAVHPVVIV